MDKSDNAYKTIGEVAKILKLKSNKKGTLPTHTIRFWEKQFKQIKPKVLAASKPFLFGMDVVVSSDTKIDPCEDSVDKNVIGGSTAFCSKLRDDAEFEKSGNLRCDCS